MPQVLVNIGGRSYRLACNPGEEEHLGALAKRVDGKIGEMQGEFRDIADQRIVVMAALSLADELFEAHRKVEAQSAECAEALAREVASRQAAEARVAALEAAIEETTARVESMTELLTAPTAD
jgi:cell division protein ZapA